MDSLKNDIDTIDTLLGMLEAMKFNQENGEVENYFINNNIRFLKELKAIKRKNYINTDERRKQFEPMLDALKKKYKCKFTVKEEEGMIAVYYDSEDLRIKLSDEENFNKLLDVCLKYLSVEDSFNLAVLYNK